MAETLAAIFTAIDVLTIYLLLPNVKYRFWLSLWTGALHMLFPLIGFHVGEWLASYISSLAQNISGILLSLIGVQLLLAAKDQRPATIPVVILAITTSLDTFSVSISFGMLQLRETLLICSMGIFAFLFSFIALTLNKKIPVALGIYLQMIAGAALLLMGIFSLNL
ncbi:manganese efflux pump [Rummeliibacillus sp. TYF-LIM-RU47]|uniref:manganese efflux pump n=1 Tax=unclassified Rummeliibacillus TaxID=2622809 RepID=UPI00123B46FF|nr:manganese efflux pump [Rummeliibacillus sp. TYF-LIM-RU47]